MLGKCVKHEFRATARQLVPLFIAMFAVSILGGLFLGFGISRPFEGGELISGLSILVSSLSMFALVILMVAVSIVAFVMIIRRFYTSFFTDEGYLSFTLPVSIDTHIISKFIVAYVWQMLVSLISLGCVAIIVSLVFAIGGDTIFAPDVGLIEAWEIVRLTFKEMIQALFLRSGTFWAVVILSVLYFLLSVASSVLMIYLSIALACMIGKKYRVLSGIACYYILSMVVSFISSILSFVLSIFSLAIDVSILLSLGSAIAITLIQIVAFYLGIKWILTHKLNLD